MEKENTTASRACKAEQSGAYIAQQLLKSIEVMKEKKVATEKEKEEDVGAKSGCFPGAALLSTPSGLTRISALLSARSASSYSGSF